MANSFDSNFTNKLMRVFLEKFETARVLSKNVNTQLLTGAFDPSTGTKVFFKRPTDYISFRDPTGDLGSNVASNITTGKATGEVQDYFTVHVDFDEADEALKMDQADQLLAPMATRIATDVELDFGEFMLKNSGLLSGTVGTPVSTWGQVADAGAVLTSSGVPMDDQWTYALNPFTQKALADIQRSLGSGGVSGELVKTAHEKATLSSNFAGMEVMSSTALASFTSPSESDLVGAVTTPEPDVTYTAAKDTMTQTIQVDGFASFSGTFPAGTVVRITGVNRLNLSTRKPVIDASGANVEFTGVLNEDATLTAGAGIFIITGPGIFESGDGVGAYNTVDAEIVDADVITVLNTENSLFQPNLFWHKQAFSIGSVPIKKLFSTDTLGTTEDGLQMRVSKGSDFTKNSQQVRIDFRPAYAALNPFFAGQGWGS